MNDIQKLKAEMKKNESMIRLPREVITALKRNKTYPRETYAETIRDLINLKRGRCV
jgi:hypothetical protein